MYILRDKEREKNIFKKINASICLKGAFEDIVDAESKWSEFH